MNFHTFGNPLENPLLVLPWKKSFRGLCWWRSKANITESFTTDNFLMKI